MRFSLRRKRFAAEKYFFTFVTLCDTISYIMRGINAMSYFSDTLLHLRRQAGLSQQALADATGLSRSAVGMYETGKREPDIETLRLLSEFFGVDMNTLTSPESAQNAELAELLEALRNRDEMRMLFKLAKDATPDDVRKAVKIIEALHND